MPVTIQKNGPVWTIINDRPEARNAVNPESAAQLVEAFEAFEKSDALVAVFCGEGGSFCAGWDLKHGSQLSNQEFQRDVVETMGYPVGSGTPPPPLMGMSRMEFNKPVIAAIEGPAVAGGMELAVICDMRVMAEDAYMGVYCRRWGVPLIDGGTIRIPRLIGQGKTMDLVLTGRKVDAQECYQIGLCERVVPTGSAREAAEAIAHEIARFPQSTMLADRKSVIEGHGMTIRDGMKLEWNNGVDTLRKDGIAGAGRFSAGAGRHGDFKEI
jgi:enoyl-CoA hydratase